MAAKLPNYLRAFRKRAGFSEEEIAYLLGVHNPGQVSRYEHFHSAPGLLTTLAYHAIFQTSPPEMFGGKYEKIAQAVRRRAKRLVAKLSRQPRPGDERKLAALRAITGDPQGPQRP